MKRGTRFGAAGAAVVGAVSLLGPAAFAHDPTPTGNEGCTPGFWKNNLVAWESTWPNVYLPTDTLGSRFSNVPAELAGKTFLEALNFKGNEGPEARLLRQAVAALLNTVHFDVEYQYGFEWDFIPLVNDALAGSAEDQEALKDQLASYNERGCPLSANVDY